MRLNSAEARQFRWDAVVSLHDSGHSQTSISVSLKIHQSSVSRIIKLCRSGQKALVSKAKGAKSKLSVAQKATLSDLLQKGSVAYGFQGEYWTNKRILKLIDEKFGVKYGERQISTIVKELGFTKQRFTKVDKRQDAAKIEEWKSEKLPAIKKKPS